MMGASYHLVIPSDNLAFLALPVKRGRCSPRCTVRPYGVGNVCNAIIPGHNNLGLVSIATSTAHNHTLSFTLALIHFGKSGSHQGYSILQNMKKFFAIAIAAVSVLFADRALAHDNKVKHGGTVQVAGGLSFELECQNGSAIIYVEERGTEMSTAGANGILTVFRGTERKVVPLEAGIGNTLVAAGGRLAHWTTAVASITFPDRRVVQVRFSLN